MLIERQVYSHPDEESEEEPEPLATVRVSETVIELLWHDRLLYRSSLEHWALAMMLNVSWQAGALVSPPAGCKYVRTTYSDGRVEHALEASDRGAS